MPRTTDGRHKFGIAPNLLARNFKAGTPGTVWLADISCVPTDEGWLHLAAVKDPATREIVGWSMSDRPKGSLAINAMRMALQNRFRTGLDIARYTAGIMRRDMAEYDADASQYTQSLGCVYWLASEIGRAHV